MNIQQTSFSACSSDLVCSFGLTQQAVRTSRTQSEVLQVDLTCVAGPPITETTERNASSLAPAPPNLSVSNTFTKKLRFTCSVSSEGKSFTFLLLNRLDRLC